MPAVILKIYPFKKQANPMSAGLMQSEYRIPKGSCVALLDDLHRAGLLRSPGFPLPDDGILIGLKKRATDRMPPSIDFSECSETDTERQLTIHWLVSERSLAADLEVMICRHGGSLKKH